MLAREHGHKDEEPPAPIPGVCPGKGKKGKAQAQMLRPGQRPTRGSAFPFPPPAAAGAARAARGHLGFLSSERSSRARRSGRLRRGAGPALACQHTRSFLQMGKSRNQQCLDWNALWLPESRSQAPIRSHKHRADNEKI